MSARGWYWFAWLMCSVMILGAVFDNDRMVDTAFVVAIFAAGVSDILATISKAFAPLQPIEEA